MTKTTPLMFIKQVRQEMSRVTWPTKNEMTVTLVMVLVLAFVASLFLLLTDTTLSYLLQLILG
jgi:preprotein translocase subunit SecE